ncbi:MAG: magnesium transporter [Planctomycetes bacterium]|nr:magnesium transporter [Planctomycetota bacterium]
MRIQLLVPEIRELLQEGSSKELVSVLQEMHPTDAAAILSALELPEIVAILSMLPVDLERDVFGYLEPDVQELYVLGAGRERVKAVLLSMLSDDRAEFLDRLDERVRSQLVPLLPNAAREDLLRRGSFREDQVGAFLSTDFAVLDEKLSARAAIAELRRQAPSKETIYYSYVLDRKGCLIGFVSLRDLILAGDDQPVAEVMKTDLVSISADADQEQAAQIIRDYDLIALPVVDQHKRLVGIVTHDDAVDIVAEEAQEDFEKMAGITGHGVVDDDYDHASTPILAQFRRRAPVLCLLAVFWVITAGIIQGFEEHLKRGSVLLLALLPMVMATGGMVGTQASALIIRALTTGNAGGRVGQVLWKELRVATVMAAALAAIAFGDAVLISLLESERDPWPTVLHSAGVIALAMTAHVVSAALLGALTPLVVKKLRGDPAMISTPAVTAIADLTGATIYLVLVTMLLTGG